MKQTRLQTLVETIVGTIFAFVTGVVVGQLLIYPAFGLHPSWMGNFWMTMAFTAVSMTRAYIVRRFFNWMHHR